MRLADRGRRVPVGNNRTSTQCFSRHLKRLQHHGCAALSGYRVGIVNVVPNEFSSRVICGEAPQVWRVNALGVIAEAVIALKPVQRASKAPITLSGKAFEGDGIDGAGEPVVRRIPARRPVGWNVYRTPAERI